MQEVAVISIEMCENYLAECEKLRADPDISVARATVITAVCRAWIELARQVRHYNAIVEREGNSAPNRTEPPLGGDDPEA
jgi:hypothetical protein